MKKILDDTLKREVLVAGGVRAKDKAQVGGALITVEARAGGAQTEEIIVEVGVAEEVVVEEVTEN